MDGSHVPSMHLQASLHPAGVPAFTVDYVVGPKRDGVEYAPDADNTDSPVDQWRERARTAQRTGGRPQVVYGKGNKANKPVEVDPALAGMPKRVHRARLGESS